MNFYQLPEGVYTRSFRETLYGSFDYTLQTDFM